MYRYFRFRYRRFLRKARRDLRLYRRWLVHYVERHLYGKWHQVRVVRRFLILWWLIIAVSLVGITEQLAAVNILASATAPVAGGTYVEAAVGTVQNLNPVLPESDVSNDLNSLIFSGLTRFNSNRQIIPDLATSWNIASDGQTYTFHLRHGVKWQDGVPFTSADVAFTITAIQDPDSRSPLASSWQGVTVTTPDPYTVVFSLPQPLDSFLDSTTVGVVPLHILGGIDPTQLRTAAFNQDPVGTGPFKLDTFAPQAGDVELDANPNYYFGKPNIAKFIVKLYNSPADVLTAYEQQQVTSPGQLDPSQVAEAEQLPGLQLHVFTLPQEQVLFFNTQDPTLSDSTLRGILSRSLNRAKIMQQGDGGYGQVVTQPLLPGQIGYTDQYAQSQMSRSQAAQALESDGWHQDKPGAIRQKNGQPLTLTLVTQSGGEFERDADEIKREWSDPKTGLGIGVNIVAVDADQLQQTYMRPRNFQMVLYGINIGADPDVYSFWHSSQAKDPGINLSQYQSTTADHALESARINTDPNLRKAKYGEFLQAWNSDEPAAVLYQSAYLYATKDTVAGIMAKHLVTPSDRFYNVQRWTVQQQLVPAY
jgi:peptide/nickel transport system substrate-binding protein